MRKAFVFAGLLFAGVAFFSISSSFARQNTSGSGAPVTTVVTVLGHDFSPPPPITKEEVTVYSGKNREDVTSWIPARGDQAGLQLAILIDDSDSPTSIGSHFTELRNFITSQPSSTQVGVFYAANGAADAVSEFSADHDAVAQKIRLPLGRRSSDSPSIYLSLQDLAKHWPSNGMRHEVLMIASGVDHLYPGFEDPYFASALKSLQTAGVVVHTIYAGGPGLARAGLRMDIAQSNLSQLAGGTGGEPFFQGLETPVDFGPILRDLDIALKNQYFLTFTTPRSEKKSGEVREIKVRVEQQKVKLDYPKEVFVPGV
jgi:hypothetical protein